MSIHRPLLILALLAVFPFSLPLGCRAAELGAQRTYEGRYSVVRLLGVVRTHPRYLSAQMKGARDGLTFLFFIGRRPPLEGLFSPVELRDFRVEGKSYREMSLAALGRTIEPITTIDDIPDFVRQFPLVADDVPTGHEMALSMVVTIGGTILVEGRPGEVTIDVGWGDKHEKFNFNFHVPPKRP